MLVRVIKLFLKGLLAKCLGGEIITGNVEVFNNKKNKILKYVFSEGKIKNVMKYLRIYHSLNCNLQNEQIIGQTCV